MKGCMMKKVRAAMRSLVMIVIMDPKSPRRKKSKLLYTIEFIIF